MIRPAATLALAGLLALSARSAPQDGGSETTTESSSDEAPVELSPPPPRALIAGMPGFSARSRITFFSAPDLPHELRVVVLFPERARFHLSATGADWQARQLEYRSGNQFFFVASGTSNSEQLEELRRAELELRVELRRALLLWPDGFDWKGQDHPFTVAIAGAGSLEALQDEAGQLVSMSARRQDGSVLEAYSVLEWFEQGGRTWPRSMVFSYGGEQVWREELLEINTRVNYLDWFFIPADRRAQQLPEFGPAAQVRTIDLPPFVVRHFEIDGDLAWKDLLEQAATLVETARSELERAGLAVEAPVNFLLSADGRATHCELRLTTRDLPPPPGWTAVAERPALTLFETGPPRGLEAQVQRLRGLAPPDAAPGQPYVRARPSDGPGGKLQIVLPLLP